MLLLALACSASAVQATSLPPVLDEPDDLYTLPEGLLVGAGISACQAEGAWNVEGKAESLLDFMTHYEGQFLFPDTPEIGADHYKRWKEDLALAKQLGFTSHRFSISWSRLIPNGDPNQINPKGLDFYNKYIDELIRLKLEPMVTMLHFDQPYSVEVETKGWHHSEIADKFVQFANVLFDKFGDRVKYWNTINEPNMYCNYFPTMMNLMGIPQEEGSNVYQCLHNMILAQAKVYRLYEKKYKNKQNGLVGASVLLWPGVPATTNIEDVLATDQFNQLLAGTYLHPIVYGDYSPTVKFLVDARTAELGLNKSRLPEFTSEQKTMLAGGVADFIALNVYSKFEVSYVDASSNNSRPSLLGPIVADIPNVALNGSTFGPGDETLMHDALQWTWNTYHKPIVISENGYADEDGLGLRDTKRAAYHSVNMRSLVRTMKNYNIKVLAYYMWALLDLFEFQAGYFKRPFGVIHVDYKSGSLNRTLKDSAKFFIELGQTKKIPLVEMPSSSATILAPTVLLTGVTWLCTKIASHAL